MTRYTFFNYTGCFWKHYVELTEINKVDEKYDKCLICNGVKRRCKRFKDTKELEHILDEIRERSFR